MFHLIRNSVIGLLFIYPAILHAEKEAGVENGLKVSTSGHYLADAVTGEPVFLLATTAWNINALTYPEIDTLIKAAATDGFNAIMFTLDFFPQADEANIYGQKAYMGPDKTVLNPAYFTYCDYIINECTSHHMYPMIYTMWSGKNSGIMNNYTAEQLLKLGRNLGAKFKGNRNVILVAGGESSPPYIDTALVNAIATGLKEGSEGNNLITVHPTSPHSSSEYYANCSWLDFNLCQGKSNIGGTNFDLTKDISRDYNLAPAKPTLVAEHRYESGNSEDPIIQRRSLYLSVFAGGAGYAYGHNALWQMTPHTAQKWMLKSWNPGVDNWVKALNTEAATQLHHIRSLLYACSFFTSFPDKSLIIEGQGDSISSKIAAMRNGTRDNNDADYLMAYLSSSKTLLLKTNIIKSARLSAYWFNPRNGFCKILRKNFKNTGVFRVPDKYDTQDWVIIISNVSKKQTLPFAPPNL